MYDVKITNGTIVDGTGAPRFVGDVAREGRRDRRGVASRRSTATRPRPSTPPGCVVTPGFVDIHTHYDGQATWDPLLEPSSGHGVTTVVAGNCGVGFAPVRPGDEKWLISLMEGVEDIPGTALTEGIDWSWETFPEYLDALDGARVRHRRRRAGVARRGAGLRDGGAGRGQRAGEPRRDRGDGRHRAGGRRGRRARLLDVAHARRTGPWTAGRCRARSPPRTSCSRSGRAMKAGGRAVFELAPLGASGEDLLAPEQEMGWMVKLSDDLDLPVSFTLLQIDAAPDAWRGLMDESLRAYEAGAQVVPQVAARPFGMLLGFPTRHGFSGRPTYRELAGAPVARRAARRAGEAGGAGADPRRGRRRSRPDGAVRRHVPAGAGLARPPLLARRPARLRADPRPHDRGDGRGGRRRPAGDALRRHARARRAAPAHAAVLQLRRAQPRRHPRDAAAPGRRVRPVRRRRALRADLRRVDPHVHAHALGARPHPRARRCRSSTW